MLLRNAYVSGPWLQNSCLSKEVVSHSTTATLGSNELLNSPAHQFLQFAWNHDGLQKNSINRCSPCPHFYKQPTTYIPPRN